MNSHNLLFRLSLLVGLALPAIAILRAEEDGPSESAKKETNTENRSTAKSFFNFDGDPKKAEESIKKIEQQLKESNLPEDLTQKAIEAMRAGLRKDGKGNFTVEYQTKDGKPIQSSVQSGSNLRVFAPPMFSMRPSPEELKERLVQNIEKSVDAAKLESEVAVKLIESLKDAVNKTFEGETKEISYRIGIGLSERAGDDGIRVAEVADESPAAKAGIQAGDKIVSVNGQLIQDSESLVDAVQAAGKSDKELKLVILSGDDEKTIELKPEKQETSFRRVWEGMGAQVPPAQPFGFSPGVPMVQGWVMNPDDMQKMQGQFQFKLNESELPENIRKMIEANVKKALQSANKNIGAKKGDEVKSKKYSDDDNDESLRDEIDELEDEIAEIKSMLQKLIDKK
jgi:hypothetical protein